MPRNFLMTKYPKYVKIKYSDNALGCALQWDGAEYCRDAGAWEVGVKVVDGKLLIDSKDRDHLEHLDGLELVEVTRDAWGKDNAGYTQDPKYDGDRYETDYSH
jgi:hypothetical protein